jgi:hypothetical protein
MLLEANIRKMLVNGEQWASWHGYHIPVSEKYIAIWTPAGTEMCWKTGGWISKKHQLTYLWRDEWYTIHIGYDLDGRFISGYCDVVLPTDDYSNTASELLYTDLYIDVVIREDFSVFTKDQEVFERAAHLYPIVAESRQPSFMTLDQLEEQAKQWSGPFSLFPRSLPRIDFEQLTPEEAASVLRKIAKQP